MIRLVTTGMDMIQDPGGAESRRKDFFCQWLRFPAAVVFSRRSFDQDAIIDLVSFDSSKWTGLSQ